MADLESWFADKCVDTVECVVPDLQGVAKGKVVPVAEFLNGGIRLPEAVFGQDVTGAWCENYDLIDVNDTDMVLVPAPDTIVVQPWTDGDRALCICDSETLGGEALEIAPRAILKSVIARLGALGLEARVAQEAEFYLVEPNPDPRDPISPPRGDNGRRHRGHRSFQTEVLGEFGGFLDRVRGYSDAQGIEVISLEQEMGPGQFEVNFRHGEPLSRADAMFHFKRLVRQAATDAGYYASFLAKPMRGQPGSAMHMHQSLVDDKGGNAFAADEDLFMAFIAGLQKYTPALMPIYAPNPNSYRRFIDADSCPINTEWGYDNRTTGFRVPDAPAEATRIENRIPGADTNPYLVIAASLLSGCLGIEEKLEPSKPIADSAWDLESTLASTLDDALQTMAGCEPVVDALGQRFVGLYLDVKRREDEAFRRTVTAWEREFLMLSV